MGKFKDYLLGGPTVSVVGDGRVYVATPTPSTSPNQQPFMPFDRRPSSAKSSISSSSMGSARIEFSGTGHSKDVSERTSPSVSPIIGNDTVQVPLFGSSDQLDRIYSEGRHVRVPNGVRAPRCSIAPPAPSPATFDSPRPSLEPYRTASPNSMEEPERPSETPWQDYEIPEELGLVKADAPSEILIIVQESLDEQRAMRISRMQNAASVKLNAQRSAPSLGVRQMIDDNVSLPTESGALLKPPQLQAGLSSRTSSQEGMRLGETSNVVLGPSMSDLERKFQESKSRTRKGYKRFKILPGRRMKDEPTPPLLRVEPTVSECTSCFDDIPNDAAVNLPCRHKYCRSCFSHLISTAIQSEDTFPPKCCLSEVPKPTMYRHLPGNEWKSFSEKALEYAVPVASRYYCASPPCARWIDARNAKRKGGAMECPHCKENLCTTCRGPSHPSNEDCPQDFGLDRLLEEAEWSGWRRCIQCREMVERHDGCLHITCKCHYQFCYCCGARWRTCQCTETDQKQREKEGRARKAQYEADQRVEEEEVRAAIAAVEAAAREIQLEREAEEKRMAQEAREMETLETERLSNIADYYEYLRSLLECVRLQQRQAIEKRHDQEWAEIDRWRDEMESADKAAAREEIVNAERAEIIAQTAAKIRDLQRGHAHAMMETIARHRKAQDEQFAALTLSQEADGETQSAKTLENLMLMQEAERSTLNAQQKREIQKWKGRHEVQLREFDAKSKLLRLRLKELEDISQREKTLKGKISAESRWFDLLFEERITMLCEDRSRMMHSGADAPPKPLKRDTVIVPKKEAPPPGSATEPTIAADLAMSMRGNLGIPILSAPPPSPTTGLQRSPRTHRANSGRSARYEPNWDEINAITNAHKQGEMNRVWFFGAQVRVG